MANLESVINNAKESNTKIAEDRIWKWTVQILCELGQLHTKDVCHRAITPANIFLDEEDNVRVGDIGVALQLTDDAMAQTQLGDLFYVCPEVACKLADDSKCDVWSLGCVLHELMTLEKPFLGANAFDLLDTITYVLPADISEDYSWHIRMLSMWMLQKIAKYRPTTLDVYSFFLRNWPTQAKAGLSQIKPESVPWASDLLMDDEGKMEWDGYPSIGMTAEERHAMPSYADKKKDAASVQPAQVQAEDIPGSVGA